MQPGALLKRFLRLLAGNGDSACRRTDVDGRTWTDSVDGGRRPPRRFPPIVGGGIQTLHQEPHLPPTPPFR